MTRASAEDLLHGLSCGRPGCVCTRAVERGSGLTHCPAHADERPSLSVTDVDGHVLVHCHAGCSQDAVIDKLLRRGFWPSTPQAGSRSSGLTLAALAQAKALPEAFLRGLRLRDTRRAGQPAVAIPYFDASGTEVGVRYRLALEGGQRFAWQRGDRVLPYGLWRLGEARRHGWVLIVEGESDCWTAWYYGIPALGIPGKATWKAEWAAHLKGLKVYVWVEPDADDFALRIGADNSEARVIRAPEGLKDISEAHVAGRDVAALIEELKAKAAPVAQLRRAVEDAELAQLEALARPVLEADDPLALVAEELRGLGYGGDISPALVTYLAATTRLLVARPGTMPAHLLLTGPAASGKSFTVQSVLRLLPDEAYHEIDACSPRAVLYDDASLRHRVLVIGELDSLREGEGTENTLLSALRALLSEARVRYDVTVRDKETGRFYTEHIEKPGPTVLITTGTRVFRDPQMASRVFTVAVPEDGERVRTVLAAQARAELSPPPEPSEALVAFQAYLQRRAPWDVKVPFVEALAELLGKRGAATRMTRDFEKLLALVKAVALLRHRHRDVEEGRLLATLEDYEAVRQLVAPIYDASVTGASEQVRAVVEAVAELRRSGIARVGYADVAKRLKLHPEQVRRLAHQAVTNGWLTSGAEGRGRPVALDVAEPLPPAEALPTAEELRAASRTFTEVSQLPGFSFTVSRPFRGDVRPEPTPTPAPARRASAPGEEASRLNDVGEPPGLDQSRSTKQLFLFGEDADAWEEIRI